jgi:excisionase family DNA binding protein
MLSESKEEHTMITIPLNTNPGIQIPMWQTEPTSEVTKTENVERLGVSIQEAAKMLGISKPHFYPLIREGKVRTVSIGKRIVVSVQSLRDFIDGKPESSESAEPTQ